MKIFLLFVFLFFSTSSFSEVQIYIGDREVECVYNQATGATVCDYVNASGDTPGVWNPKTFSCTNFVAPVVNAAGDISCPSINKVKISNSASAPDPSKYDVACDLSKPLDPNNPELGCASQKTLIKTNDLISESNSKLGSIASGTATNTGLLSGILGTLQGIASQGAGTGIDENDCSAFPNNSSCFTNKNISTLSPVLVSFGSCPASESFFILGSNYEFSYELVCNFLDSIRGLVVAMGVLSALLIVVTAL